MINADPNDKREHYFLKMKDGNSISIFADDVRYNKYSVEFRRHNELVSIAFQHDLRAIEIVGPTREEDTIVWVSKPKEEPIEAK